MLMAADPASAQAAEPLVNVVQLSAQAEVDVTQDLLRMTLSSTRQGAQSALVQSQLKEALDAALAKAKKAVSPGEMDVHTGNFSLYPRYDKEGRISNWQGTAELILEGKDFPRITRTAGEIDTLTVSNISFGLSRDQRVKVENGAQQEAIQHFRAKAKELAQGFGFKDYTLREISVNANENGGLPGPRTMAMAAKSFDSSSAPVPVEPGKSRVTVNISGAVQMR
jgi:predicted secreted protein